MAIEIFKRVEQKYVINENQKTCLIPILLGHMKLDKYCVNESTYKIKNIYLDTDDNNLIRTSLLKPAYKEKLRIRKYDKQAGVFVEIKKKYQGVVSKRRCEVSEEELDNWIYNKIKPLRNDYVSHQIIEEIDYLFKQYDIHKSVYIAYDRLGFFDLENPELRITFDSSLRYKKNDLSWDDENTLNIIPENNYILEIKNVDNLPFWLVKALNQLNILKSSFSKYGTEYNNNLKENINYAK